MKTKKKRKRKLEVDDEIIAQVERLAGLGLSQKDIALVLGVSATTFHMRKRESEALAEAYKEGRAKGLAMGANCLRKLMAAGNVAATIFFLKTQGGWREVERIEVSGPDGGPQEIVQRQVVETADLCREYMVSRQEQLSDIAKGNGNGSGSNGS